MMLLLVRWLWVVILTTSLCGCKQPASEVEINAEVSVYQAVIGKLYLSRVIPNLLVIRDHTSIRPMDEDDLEQMVDYIQENLGKVIDKATLKDFKAKNKQPQPLEGRLKLSIPVAFINDADLTALFQHGGGWEQFYETYPGSPGVITLSRVGFNRDMSQAIVCVGNSGGVSEGIGYYLFLTWDGSGWQIEEQVVAWIV